MAPGLSAVAGSVLSDELYYVLARWAKKQFQFKSLKLWIQDLGAGQKA